MQQIEEPFITEIAVHHFDSFRYLFDREPAAMLANSYQPPLSDYRGRAALDAVIEMAGGLLIQYAGTMVATRYEFGLWVEGSDGELWTDRRQVWWRQKAPLLPPREARPGTGRRRGALSQGRDRVAAQSVPRRADARPSAGDQRSR